MNVQQSSTLTMQIFQLAISVKLQRMVVLERNVKGQYHELPIETIPTNEFYTNNNELS